MIKNKVAAGLYYATNVLGAYERSNVPLDNTGNPDTTSEQYLASIDVLIGVTKDTATRDASYAKSQNYQTVLPLVRKLNDTGITTCTNSSQNGLPCPALGFPGQDAESGRDVTHNDDSDGHAGFSFTKISNTGQPLDASATSWNCVQDNVTGLMWEVKTDDGGLHDKDWTYSWYEPDNTKNGGSAGYQNDGWCIGTCDTYSFVQVVNAESWCGHNDWRIPTIEELFGLSMLEATSYDQGENLIFSAYKAYFNWPGNFWSSNFVNTMDGIGNYFRGTVYLPPGEMGTQVSWPENVQLVRGEQ